MKHNIGDDRERRSSSQRATDSSTIIFVTAEELERRKALADEADRIRAAIGPLGFSAVDVIRDARDGSDAATR